MGIIYAGSRALSRLVRNARVEVSSLPPRLFEQTMFPSYKGFNDVLGLGEKKEGGGQIIWNLLMVLGQQSSPTKCKAVIKSIKYLSLVSLTVWRTQHLSKILVFFFSDRSLVVWTVQSGKKLQKSLAVSLQKSKWDTCLWEMLPGRGWKLFQWEALRLYKIWENKLKVRKRLWEWLEWLDWWSISITIT